MAEVEAVTREVLETSNLNEITEKQLRLLVRERTGADTSLPDLKALIHTVVEEFVGSHGDENGDAEDAEGERERDPKRAQGLSSSHPKGKKRRVDAEEEDEVVEEEQEEDHRQPAKKSSKASAATAKQGGKKFAVGDSGELIVCKLSNKRRVTVGEYKGTMFVSIREFYEKDGQERPGKGISLPVEQWETLAQHADDVTLAIKQAKR